MEDPSTRKSLVIFGRDVAKIPCFRNSYLYGISSGLGIGLAYFMFTSRVLGACNIGVSSCAVVTMGYWFRCRYNFSKAKFEMLKVQEALKNKATYEGTDLDTPIINELDLKDV